MSFQSGCTLFHSHQQCGEVLVNSHPLQHQGLWVFSILAILGVVFCVFLIEMCFSCAYGCCKSSLLKFKPFAPLCSCSVGCLILELYKLFILWIQGLCQICITNMPSQSVTFHFLPIPICTDILQCFLSAILKFQFLLLGLFFILNQFLIMVSERRLALCFCFSFLFYRYLVTTENFLFLLNCSGSFVENQLTV